MKRLKLSLILFVIAFVQEGIQAQNIPLTLEQCYELARQNYPLIIQKELINQSKEFTIGNAHSGNLTGNNQNIFDGGTIKRTSALHETNALIVDQRAKVELYKIKDCINQIYFGILLIDQQIIQTDLVKKDIQMNADILEAEMLKTEQRTIEIRASRRVFLAMLSLFIKQDLPDNTALVQPVNAKITMSDYITRPELSLFNYPKMLAQSQYELTRTKNIPRAGLFVQVGYGKPATEEIKFHHLIKIDDQLIVSSTATGKRLNFNYQN